MLWTSRFVNCDVLMTQQANKLNNRKMENKPQLRLWIEKNAVTFHT